MINLTILFDRRSGTSNLESVYGHYVTMCHYSPAQITVHPEHPGIVDSNCNAGIRPHALQKPVPFWGWFNGQTPTSRQTQLAGAPRGTSWVFRTLSWYDPRYCPGRRRVVRGCRWPALTGMLVSADTTKVNVCKESVVFSYRCLQTDW